MKVVGYVRVSTDAQVDGLGLEVQERTVRAWCRTNKHRLVAVHRDEGVSGSNGVDGRVGLPVALAQVADGTAGAVVVARLDRLARDLVLQETLLAEVWRSGGEVLSCAGGEGDLRDDPDDPSRALIRQVLGAVSQYERSMITLRLRSGRARKAERGGYAHGSPPYGWRSDSGVLVEVQEEQEVLTAMRELAAAGLSVRAICQALNVSETPSKRGGRWHPTTVSRALARDGH